MIGPRDTFEVRAVVTASVGDDFKVKAREALPERGRDPPIPSTKVGTGVHVGDPKRPIIASVPSTDPSSNMLPLTGRRLPRIATAISQFVQGELYPGKHVASTQGGYRSIVCIRASLYQRSDVKTQSQARGYLEKPWGS